MEKCPGCGKYLLTYDSVREVKRCVSKTCKYEKYYCRNRYYIEHDVLPKLVADGVVLSHKQGKCRNPKGWRECDTCELRA